MPLPGIYGTVEIRHSQRGHWYAIRHREGGFDYLAQNIDLDEIAGPSEQDQCLTPGCALKVWHRNLCGMCLATDAVTRLRSIK